ncbi:MAG: TonB-dependent receptor [Flavobacteriaceae bacterium]|nr:TonB-dependent receptor [Flavobacteriaceae bacterium]
MKLKNSFIVVMLLVNIAIMAQTSVVGVVIDKNTKQPIAYALVKSVTGKSTYTITDINGKFEITIIDNSDLEVSHLGYKTVIQTLTNNAVISLEEKPVSLENIIVNANPLQDISHSVVINNRFKKVSQPRSVGDLFKDIKGFGIQKRGAFNAEPVFRAFRYEELNILFDGGMKTVGAGPNRMDPVTTHIIPEEIEKIEIVKGPFTVRFGQNFGGIINLVLKTPNKEDFGFHGNVESGFESNGSNLTTRTSLQYASDKFDILLNGALRDFGNYKDGNSVSVPSEFNTKDYSIKTGFNFSNKQRLQFSFRQNFAKNIKYAGLPMDAVYDESSLLGLNYKIKEVSKTIESITVNSYYTNVRHLMTNKYRPNIMMVEAFTKVYATTYGGKIELLISPNAKSLIFAGADAYLIERNGNRKRKVKIMNGTVLPMPMNFVDKVWQDAKVNDYGLFAEGKYYLSPLLTFTSGLRLDLINASISDVSEDFLALYDGSIQNASEENFSGNIGLKYKTQTFQSQIAFGRGVRTASMIERYINHFNIGIDPYEYVGNPNLRPEINNQIEISFSKVQKNLKVGGSLFYSFITDFITAKADQSIPRKFMPTTPPIVAKRFINVKKAFQTGFEFDLNYALSHVLRFKTELSYTYAKNEDFNEPLPQIMPLTSRLNLAYEKKNYWFNIETRMVAMQNRISDTFSERVTPGYILLNFRSGIKFKNKLQIGAAALNILDKSYVAHLNFSFKNSDLLSGRILEPGRNFTVYLNYKF